VAGGGGVTLRCALPVNNVELSSSGSDNDLTRIRVHYRDTDAYGFLNFVFVSLVKTIANAAGTAEATTVCQWNSSVDGIGATNTVKASKACPHDFAPGAFYHFSVVLQAVSGQTAQFLGIDFP
jgi:hypothetical protein